MKTILIFVVDFSCCGFQGITEKVGVAVPISDRGGLSMNAGRELALIASIALASDFLLPDQSRALVQGTGLPPKVEMLDMAVVPQVDARKLLSDSLKMIQDFIGLQPVIESVDLQRLLGPYLA